MQPVRSQVVEAIRANETAAVLAKVTQFALAQSHKKHGTDLIEAFGHQIHLVNTYNSDPQFDEHYYYVEFGGPKEPNFLGNIQFDTQEEAEAHALKYIPEQFTPAEIIDTLEFLESETPRKIVPSTLVAEALLAFGFAADGGVSALTIRGAK